MTSMARDPAIHQPGVMDGAFVAGATAPRIADPSDVLVSMPPTMMIVACDRAFLRCDVPLPSFLSLSLCLSPLSTFSALSLLHGNWLPASACAISRLSLVLREKMREIGVLLVGCPLRGCIFFFRVGPYVFFFHINGDWYKKKEDCTTCVEVMRPRACDVPLL